MMREAQGSIEYLLLIGGAILLAVIVLSLISSIAVSGVSELLSQIGIIGDIFKGFSSCDSSFELERHLLIIHGDSANINVSLDGAAEVRRIRLNPSIFGQGINYAVSVDSAVVGSGNDSTESIVFDDLSISVNPPEFNLKIDKTDPNVPKIEVDVETIVLLCN